MKKTIAVRIALFVLLILLTVSVSQRKSLGQGSQVPGSASDSCGGGCINFDDGSPGCASYGINSTGVTCAMFWWPNFGMNECRQSTVQCVGYGGQ